MHHPNVEEETRPIVMRTLEGEIVGTIPINPSARTLDWLNREGAFLSIRAETLDIPDCILQPGDLAMNRPSVVFVAERDLGGPKTDKRIEASHFRRCAITVRAGDCDIHGFIHVRDKMDIVRHLSTNSGPFFAITAASIVGPDFELVTNFVAVNVSHVVAVQSVGSTQDVDSEHAHSMTDLAIPER